jgi:DNA repair exonuclease SbcCD nuclease subunit
MSFKFALVGDVQQRKQSPENRLDDFYETLKSKIKEIVDKGYSEQVDAFLLAGDFYDIPMPSMSVVTETTRLWLNGIDISKVLANPYKNLTQMAKLQEDYEYIVNQIVKIYDVAMDISNPEDRQKKLYKDIELLVNDIKSKELILLEDAKNIKHIIAKEINKVIPLITVAGNHDLYGNSISTINRTMLGFLINLGILRLITKDNPYIITKNGLSCAITGTSYHSDIDTEGFESDYIIDKKLGDKHIHIVHGMLHHKSMGSKIRHTTIDKIASTLADFTYAGHEHNGFPLTERDGRYYYNSGAIPRLSIAEVERMPKIGILSLGEDTFNLQEYFLKSAKKGEEILDLSKKANEKQKEEEFAEFRQAVKDAGKIEGYNVLEIVNSLASNKKIKTKVRDKALDMVSRAMEKLDDRRSEQC